jgi:two-component system chemotaxis sensor kinase CheA
MGLIVDEIVDIVDQHMQVELTGEGSGLLGSAIIAGKATDVIDAGFYLTQAYHDWFQAHGELGEKKATDRVLVVDDSPFFRNMLTPMLTVAGFQVTAVGAADEALALREDGESFDIIVSDIEMPGMNGFDFAEAVRSGDSKWHETPIIALSSHTSARDLERGRRAGFTDYVAKFDRDTLVHTLTQTLAEMRGSA